MYKLPSSNHKPINPIHELKTNIKALKAIMDSQGIEGYQYDHFLPRMRNLEWGAEDSSIAAESVFPDDVLDRSRLEGLLNLIRNDVKREFLSMEV